MTVVLVLAPTVAHAAWRRNERGECVRFWTPASLARGPIAILNAPLVPIRTEVGLIEWLVPDTKVERKLEDRMIVYGISYPLIVVFGGPAMGLFEALRWMSDGLGDVFTGGYFELASDEATQFSVAPLPPNLVSKAPAPQPEHCSPK